MNNFMNGREMVDLIFIIDKNQIIGEFFLNSDTEMILLYKNNLIKLSKVSKIANFDDIREDSNIGNTTEEENFDIQEGVMLGIKTLVKRLMMEYIVDNNDEYRTLIYSCDNWKIGNIYEKPNIIFPRLNGIWKLK